VTGRFDLPITFFEWNFYRWGRSGQVERLPRLTLHRFYVWQENAPGVGTGATVVTEAKWGRF